MSSGAGDTHDHVCRVGGEEFTVIRHNNDLKSALELSERLRQKVGETTIRAGEVALHLSVSTGIACREESMPDADSLVVPADRALHAARHAGRDRTCLSSAGRPRSGGARMRAHASSGRGRFWCRPRVRSMGDFDRHRANRLYQACP